jgi:hypothetical protein
VAFRLCPEDNNAFNPDPTKRRVVRYKKLPVELKYPNKVPEKNSIWVKLDDQPPMFSELAPAPVLAIDDLKVLGEVLEQRQTSFVAHLSGSKFAKGDQVLVNNSDAAVTPLATGLFKITFKATDSPTLEVTVIHKGEKDEDTTYATKSFPNPTIARVDKVTITHYIADAKPRPILGLSLAGVGFDHFSQVEVPGADIRSIAVSPTTMTLDLRLNPKDETIRDTIRLFLTDSRTGLRIPVVIDRPSEPASSANEANENDDSATPTKPTKPRKPKPRRKGSSTGKPTTPSASQKTRH